MSHVAMQQRSSFPLRQWLISLVIAAFGLCSVAFLNGGPIYYPDTGAYLLDADRLAHLQLPFAVRPVFYGLAIFPLHWGTTFFPALLAQALIVAHIIYLTMRVCRCELRPSLFLVAIALLVLFTPISFHVSHLLPDIFVGVLILALFLLGFCRDSLRRWEICYLVLLAAAAASFHLTALPVGAALFVLCLAAAIVTRQHVAPLLVLAPVVLATLGLLAFSAVVFQQLALTPKNPPHFLARILADGPGRAFLRETCPRSGFILCDYQDKLTPVEDDFLWRLLPSIPPADGYRIKAEQGAVVRGTIAMFPMQVIEHMLGNTLRQLITFHSETQVSDPEWDAFQAGGTPLARSLANSLQGERWFEGSRLATINALHAGIALASLLASLFFAALALRARQYRLVALVATVLTGLAANAFACGAFGGVFGRYQGRVIWLLPLAAIVGAIALFRARSSFSSGRDARVRSRLQAQWKLGTAADADRK